MDYFIETSPLDKLQNSCLLLGVHENGQLLPSSNLTPTLAEKIQQALHASEFQAKHGETLLLNIYRDDSLERVLLVGAGKNETMSRKLFRKVLSAAITAVKGYHLSTVVSLLADLEVDSSSTEWKVRQTIEVFSDAAYQYTHTKKQDTDSVQLQQVTIIVPPQQQAAAEIGRQQGLAIAHGMELTKSLGDLPGNICTPTYLAEQARKLADQHADIAVEVLEEDDMQTLGMGSFLAVARGSRQPAKLICLTYSGAAADQKPVVLIGKGLTFDAGGISLKPGPGMEEMKYDMCGGATVLGVAEALAELKLPVNLVGLIPSSENMPDGNANKPGDVLTSMSGQTIEVLNTDAEGRLILCDTLTYAKKYNPDVVIDMATLTGACLVALGRIPSGLLGNDDKLCEALIDAGEDSCDTVWRLPIWEEYQELLKSNFADMANIGGKDAGTITAACFLAKFAEDYQWAHLDIAGTAWRTGQNIGATGRPVPLIVQYLLNKVDD